MAEILLRGKRLAELKVTELKEELDKRSLPKKGVKNVLITRLKNAILKEELEMAEAQKEDSSAEELQETDLNSSMDVSQDDEEGPDVKSPPQTIKSVQCVLETLSPEIKSPTHVASEPTDGTAVQSPGKNDSGTEQEPLASTPTATATANAELANQQLEEQSHDTPATLPSDGARDNSVSSELPLETSHGTPVLDESHDPASGSHDAVTGSHDSDVLEFIPLGSIEDSEDSIGAEDSGVLQPESPLDEPATQSSEVVAEASEAETQAESKETITMETEDKQEESKEQGDKESSAKDENDEQKDTGAPDNQEKSADRRDSVVIDPSYHPDSEELLYEGDMDVDPGKPHPQDDDTGKPHPQEADTGKPHPQETEEPKEEGFIVHLHDTSMELEFSGNKTAAQKSTPRPKDDDASKPGQRSKEGAPQSKESSKKSTPVSRSSDCHLWVSGLVPSVRALDLQTLFSPFGKVVTAKVVAKAQSRNQRFGYVTMTTAEEARGCIKELSGTELKGRKITVEVAKSPPPLSQPSKTTPPSSTHPDRRSSTGTPSKHSPRGNIKSQDKGSEGKGTAPLVRKSLESGTRRRSPNRALQGPRSRSRERPRVRGRSPRRSPPIAIRRSPPGVRRSPPGMRRSPPGVRKHRSPSPPSRGSVHTRLGARGPFSGDSREVAMRRDVDRVRRVSGEHILRERERERQVEMHLHERRLAQEREHELARRQLEAERTRQEQEMARRVSDMRERDAREREARERQLAEQERVYRERERELREREIRERQRREVLEKELGSRDLREREFRDREKRLKEAYERDLQAREIKSQREKEAREREARVQGEREREFRERERKLKEESERIEAARRHHEEEERRFRANREREETERREREERERRERERKILEDKNKRKQEEEARAKREREKREEEKQRAQRVSPSAGRLGKRAYEDSNSSGFDSASKRQAIHGEGLGYGSNPPASVFGRLDPHPSQKREGSSGGVQADLYRRGNDPSPYERRGGYGDRDQYGNQSRGASGYQQLSNPRVGTVSSHQTPPLFPKPVTSLHSTPLRQKPESVGLAAVTPEVMSAAAQVLSNMNKQVGLQNLPHAHRVSPQANVAAHLQQLAAVGGAAGLTQSHLQGNYDTMRTPVPYNIGQSMLRGDSMGQYLGAGSVGMGAKNKLPPENERYNRRIGGGRSGGHHSGMRGGNLYNKGGRM